MFSPGTAPNVPLGHAVHTPVSDAPTTSPYAPAAQEVQEAATGRVLYLPAAHCPVQLAVVVALSRPYVPGGHGMQLAVAAPPVL